MNFQPHVDVGQLLFQHTTEVYYDTWNNMMHTLTTIKRSMAVGFGVSLVLITIFLMIDLQIDQKMMPKRYVPMNSRDDTDLRAIFQALKRKFQFENQDLEEPLSVSEESNGISDMSVTTEEQFEFEDAYQDLQNILDTQSENDKLPDKTSARMRDASPSLGELMDMKASKNSTNLQKFHLKIRQHEMYAEDEPLVDLLLQEMSTSQIQHVQQMDGGTQLKLIIDYGDNTQALFKPMRFPREQQTLPNHFVFSDFERHTSEVASFHLDRILGFRRAMPVTVRTLNITTEIRQIADASLLETFFVSPSNNLCFFGHCNRYCDVSHAICGNPDMLEGSFAAYFPKYPLAGRKRWRHPWRRSYSYVNTKAIWEDQGQEYCAMIKDTYPYNEGRRLLDIMDMSVFDFLTGNLDRHHYETYSIFGDDTFTLHYDHGRGFGKAFHDELSILAPVLQCCMIRASTLQTLLNIHNGAKPLSQLMRESMASYPVEQILWEPHLIALDRRVDVILQSIRDCIHKNTVDDVVISYENVAFDGTLK